MIDELPDNDEVGNTGNGVPAPLLRCLLATEGGKETSQAHDDISNDGDEDVASAESGKESQVEKEEWSSERPVDITCPVDFAVDVVLGVRDAVVMRLAGDDVVVSDTVAAGHGEVGECCKGGDEGCHNVEETLALGCC